MTGRGDTTTASRACGSAYRKCTGWPPVRLVRKGHMEKEIADAQYGNTYGGLSLVERDGAEYLRMDDCLGPSFYGPLTCLQVAAFMLLRDVPEANNDLSGRR